MKKQDLKHAARGGESSSPDPVLNIVTKNELKSPIKMFKKKKIIKKEKLNFVFDAIFLFFIQYYCFYVILELKTLQTLIFLNFWNILSGSLDIPRFLS